MYVTRPLDLKCVLALCMNGWLLPLQTRSNTLTGECRYGNEGSEDPIQYLRLQ